MKCDFSGWATKNDLQCADGLVIKRDAFKEQDGQKVSLVWNHQHNSPDDVLGHAILENRDEGVYAYCTFNETESGKKAKELLMHGDIASLSIWANKLKKNGNDVIHGIIREVSLVLAGANPGAYVDSVLCHSADGVEYEVDDELVIGYNENIMLYHSDDKKDEDEKEPQKEEKSEEKKETKSEDEETVTDVINSLTEKQKQALYVVLTESEQLKKEKEDSESEKDEDDKKEGGDDMKHNVFDKEEQQEQSQLSHSAMNEILTKAKDSHAISLQSAIKAYVDEKGLQHDAISSGFADDNVELLFPEFKEVRPGEPELITSDQGWISTVMNKVHKSPISRVRTSQVDIRNIDELRARGYVKGKEKAQTGNFKLVRRTTEPTTVYVKNALHKDDITDITDFDYVAYLYKIDRMQLNEELATAVMIGDGRDETSADKIAEDKIRPIWKDDDLYTIHTDVDIATLKTSLQGNNTSANFGDSYIYAEAITQSVLYARENYKGSGTPDFYCTPHLLNVMLLARDINGRRIYSSKAELASTLNVGDIITAEQFANRTRTTSDGKTKKLLGIVCNLADYSLGSTKGGQVSHFTQFDLDFNQEKSLIETRVSGALTRVYSAIALEEDVTDSSTTDDSSAAG